MKRSVLDSLDRMIGLSTDRQLDLAVLRERFIALRRQLPWLYLIMCVNVVSIHILADGEVISALVPAVAILVLIAYRSAHLLRTNPLNLSDGAVRLELRRTFVIAASCCVAYAAWIWFLFGQLDRDRQSDLALLGGIAGIGAACGLGGLPRAARIPLILIALPCGFALILHPSARDFAIGVSLVVLASIKHRMISVADSNFGRLMTSRLLLEIEKKRALEAEQKAIAETRRVAALANSDPLTGVANRRGFQASLETLTAYDRRDLALILLDLDGFKPINDTFGHATGDALLLEVADRLSKLVRLRVPVARVGGDEFVIVCNSRSADHAIAIARRAIASLSRPFQLNGRVMRISASAGISRRGGTDVSEAMRRADIALFHAKRDGRGSVAIFTDAMQHEVQRQTAIEQALREPEMAAKIDLRFQPIFNLHSLELQSFEALARWTHSELGPIPPSEFIPISEQISVVQEISEDLLKRAAAAARSWPTSVRLSFNLSPVQLCSTETAIRVLRILADEGIDPRRLQIEVTETALLADFDLARRNLSELRREGVHIALDDFGAGYSSISYLRQIRFDAVKLDGSLVISPSASGPGLALLKGVLGLCEALGQECIAEHIETESQLQMLRALGCRYGQGFRLAPPLTAAEAMRIAQSKVLSFPLATSNSSRRPLSAQA